MWSLPCPFAGVSVFRVCRALPWCSILTRFEPGLEAINQLAPEFAALSDPELAQRAEAIRHLALAGAGPRDIRIPVFALAREAAHRALGMRPFDEQIVAALAMAEGAVVEMQTGEGKTLAAVMPATLNALTGRGVHVLTVNDYLARRDAEWMGPIYAALGLTVAFVQHEMSAADRRRAYLADVTYVTAKEAGFDHLRDLLATRRGELVHRPFHFAVVDEADSLLIDEARVPLVVAGHVGPAGLLGRADGRRRAPAGAGRPLRDDGYERNVELTDAGSPRAEQTLGCGSLHGPENDRPAGGAQLRAARARAAPPRRRLHRARRRHRRGGRADRARRGGPPLARRPAGRARGQGRPHAQATGESSARSRCRTSSRATTACAG